MLLDARHIQRSDSPVDFIKQGDQCSLRALMDSFAGVRPRNRDLALKGDITCVYRRRNMMDRYTRWPLLDQAPKIRILTATMRQEAGMHVQHHFLAQIQQLASEQMGPPCKENNLGTSLDREENIVVL